MKNKEQLDIVYNNVAASFAYSRKNMRWEEMIYGINLCIKHFESFNFSLLDIGCG